MLKVLSQKLIEQIGEENISSFMELLETLEKTDSYYVFDGKKILFEVRNNKEYLSEITEKIVSKSSSKELVVTDHAFNALVTRFPKYAAFDKNTVATLLGFAFNKAVAIGSQYGNDIMFQLPLEQEKLFLPCLESNDKIIVKTILTEQMAMANLQMFKNKMTANRIIAENLVKKESKAKKETVKKPVVKPVPIKPKEDIPPITQVPNVPEVRKPKVFSEFFKPKQPSPILSPTTTETTTKINKKETNVLRIKLNRILVIADSEIKFDEEHNKPTNKAMFDIRQIALEGLRHKKKETT